MNFRLVEVNISNKQSLKRYGPASGPFKSLQAFAGAFINLHSTLSLDRGSIKQGGSHRWLLGPACQQHQMGMWRKDLPC